MFNETNATEDMYMDRLGEERRRNLEEADIFIRKAHQAD